MTPTQIQQIATTLNPTFAPNIISGIQVTALEENYKNPQSFQFGFGYEREIAQNFVVGIDYSYVKTDHLQRNIDVNLPAPILLDPSIDPAQRPYISITRHKLCTGERCNSRPSGRAVGERPDWRNVG